MPQTDIIARIREGDRETFNAFCRERYASLIAFARLFLSRINGTWADDVVQDVLFGLWQNRASLYDDGSSLQAYLLRSVYHRCLNYLKKERRSEALDADDESKLVSRMAEYYDPDRNPVILNLFNTDLRSSLPGDRCLAAPTAGGFYPVVPEPADQPGNWGKTGHFTQYGRESHVSCIEATPGNFKK